LPVETVDSGSENNAPSSLSPIEQLLALADEKTLELAREKIGKENLALDIATAISGLCGSGDKIDVKVVAKAFGLSERQARTKIFNSGVKGKGGNHVAA